MPNKKIVLDNITIPYWTEGTCEYYPIKYLLEQFLLKSNSGIYNKNMYKPYIKKILIDWSFKNTVPQECNCMNIEGWKLYMSNIKINQRKNEDKIKRFNLLCRYFGFADFTIENKNKIIYDDYIKDCIYKVQEKHENCEFKQCANCGRILPINKNFFIIDNRLKNKVTNICRLCDKNNSTMYFLENDKLGRDIYMIFGNIGYTTYKKDKLEFYVKYVHNQSKFILDISDVKYREFLINQITQYYYNNHILKDNHFTKDFLSNFIKVKKCKNHININKLYEYCSKNDCKLRPWKYKNYTLGNVNIEKAKDLINTYIIENKIIIEDKFNFDYRNLLQKSRLTQYLNNILDFVVKFYNYEFAGYKFNIASSNYYKNIDNRIFDMKWLIEKDLKIEIAKIPLYITKNFLHTHYSCLYRVLNKKYYEGNLFKWINECYPNDFIELDFNINPYRNIFDSFEEAEVDRVLRNNLSNVIYNIRNSNNEVVILGMKPDWIIISETSGVILVEYFGMYTNNGGKEYKERLKTYRAKTQIKYKKYNQLLESGYKHLFIYPDDLKNNYQGLINKIKKY